MDLHSGAQESRRAGRGLLVVAIALIAGRAEAGVPGFMNYQGYLRDSANHAPLTGAVRMTFSLYADSAGTTPLWCETHSSVSVDAGVFNVLLGQGSPCPGSPAGLPHSLFTGARLWMQTAVNDTSLSPPVPIVSVAYAFKAAKADTATWSLGMPGSGIWSASGEDVYRPNGNVGIGITAPAAKLHVAGTSWFTGDNTPLATTSGQGIGIGFASSLDAGYLFGYDYSTGSPKNLLLNGPGGNVGIGTTNPLAKLHLDAGNGPGETNLLELSRGGEYGSTSFLQHYSSPQDAGLRIRTGSGNDVVTILNGNGRVGIGTSLPSLKLDLEGTGQNEAAIELTNLLPGAGAWQVYSGDDNALKFWSNTLQDYTMSMKSSGNVGIGTTTPDERLGVYGGLALYARPFVQPSTQGLFMYDDTSGGTIYAYNYPGSQADPLTLAGSAVRVGTFNAGQLYVGLSVEPGTTRVQGDLCVTGQKNRVVETPFGDVKMQAIEHANCVFLASGRSRTVDGNAHVELDPVWLAAVTIDDQHPLDVMVTFYGPHGDFYVVPGISGFDVVDPSSANAEFFWMVQARQKGYENVNLETVVQTAAE